MGIIHDYYGFFGAAALLLILPGPTNALLMTAGAEQRLRRNLPLLAAELVAYGLAITPLLIFNETLGAWRSIGGLAMKSIALAIVLLLAWRLWRAVPREDGEGQLVTMSSVVWMTLFNPKALIFAFAIFPPILNATNIGIKAALFVLLAAVTGAAWISAGALLSVGKSGSGWIGKVAALILCGFAIYLGMSMFAEARTVFSA